MDMLRTHGAFVKPFGMEYTMTFLEGCKCDFFDDLQARQFIQAASRIYVLSHICTTNIFLCYPASKQYVKRKAADAPGTTHLRGILLLNAAEHDDLRLFHAACKYLRNEARLQGKDLTW